MEETPVPGAASPRPVHPEPHEPARPPRGSAFSGLRRAVAMALLAGGLMVAGGAAIANAASPAPATTPAPAASTGSGNPGGTGGTGGSSGGTSAPTPTHDCPAHQADGSTRPSGTSGLAPDSPRSGDRPAVATSAFRAGFVVTRHRRNGDVPARNSADAGGPVIGVIGSLPIVLADRNGRCAPRRTSRAGRRTYQVPFMKA